MYAICLRYLTNEHNYPADMLPPVVRSPLGLPLGDWGLLPLPDALSAVGAGVVAGGPYTLPILKGCLIPFTGVSSRMGAHRGAFIDISNFLFSTPWWIHITVPRLPQKRAAQGRRGLEPLHQRGHAAHSGGVVGTPPLSRVSLQPPAGSVFGCLAGQWQG